MLSDPVQALLDATPKRSCDLGNGERLTYREFNAHHASNPHAIKLLFIPGYSTDATTLLAPELALAFPEDHYVVAVNPRGYAGSTFHNPVDNHEGTAQDIKIFMDKMGLKKDVVVMGWSTGGGAAALLAIKHPEVVRAAILKNSIALDGQRFPGVDTKEKMKDMVDTVFTPGIHNSDPEKCYESLAMFCPGIPKNHPTMRRFHEAAVAHVNREHAQWANVTFNITPIQTPTTAPSAALSQLRVPLIVLHGAKDVACSVDQVRAVTQLAIAEKWAPDDLLSYYEHEGGHCPIMIPAEAELFLRVYRRAIEEQVLNKKEEEKGKGETPATDILSPEVVSQ